MVENNLVREYTDLLLENCENFGESYKDNLILSCLKYMSEDDVKDMVIINGLVGDDGDDEGDDGDDENDD